MQRDSSLSCQCRVKKEQSNFFFIVLFRDKPSLPVTGFLLPGEQKGKELLGQGLLIVEGGDVALPGHGNLLGFLGDDNNDRVGFLGQTQGRAVTGAVALADVRILRQG